MCKILVNAKHILIGTARALFTLGGRSFQVAVPKLWNALPHELPDIPNLHTFKSNL